MTRRRRKIMMMMTRRRRRRRKIMMMMTMMMTMMLRRMEQKRHSQKSCEQVEGVLQLLLSHLMWIDQRSIRILWFFSAAQMDHPLRNWSRKLMLGLKPDVLKMQNL